MLLIPIRHTLYVLRLSFLRFFCVGELPTELALGSEDGLLMPSVVNLDVIMTSNEYLLSRRMGALSPNRMRHVDAVPCLALGLEY